MSRFFAALAAAFIATPVLSGEITLEREFQGASLHEGGVDMAVYFHDRQDHYEVVATYTGPDYDPKRIRMGLVDGDETTFGLPGFRGFTFTFARVGDVVQVTSQPVARGVALSN